MDAGAVPKLSAKRNRFWRLPLPGRVADRKRREHRPGLRFVAKSGRSGCRVTRGRFVRLPLAGLDLSHQPDDVACCGNCWSCASLTAVVERVVPKVLAKQICDSFPIKSPPEFRIRGRAAAPDTVPGSHPGLGVAMVVAVASSAGLEAAVGRSIRLRYGRRRYGVMAVFMSLWISVALNARL